MYVISYEYKYDAYVSKMSRKRKRRDHPDVIFWDQMAATCKECHLLTKKQYGYLQLLSQIATLTRHDDMIEDGIKWNEDYEFTSSSPEEIRLFLDQWWQSFSQARAEHTSAREEAIDNVRKAASKGADDISKAAMALAELENGHSSMETVIRRWARLVRAPAGYTLESLQDVTNSYIDRWLNEWGETAAKLNNMTDAYDKLVKHREIQQNVSD